MELYFIKFNGGIIKPEKISKCIYVEDIHLFIKSHLALRFHNEEYIMLSIEENGYFIVNSDHLLIDRIYDNKENHIVYKRLYDLLMIFLRNERITKIL